MSPLLLSLTILATQVAAPIEAYNAEALEVYRCDFGQPHDADFDKWPDGWTRRHARGYPRYLEVEIQEAGSNGYLRMQLDGGAVAVYTPPIEVSPHYSYIVQGNLKTEGLKHNHAYIEVTFLDENQQTLGKERSVPIRGTTSWQAVRIGPLLTSTNEARYAVLSLHLEPADGEDLFGSASFDNIFLGRLPRMTLHTNSPHNVYVEGEEIRITCEVSGVEWPDAQLQVEMYDVFGRPVMAPEPLEVQSVQPAGFNRVVSARPVDIAAQQLSGVCIWKPPVQGNGFYRVCVSMRGQKDALLQRSTTLAILPGGMQPASGQFGWSFAEGTGPLTLQPLSDLLGRVGINWAKLPVWYSDANRDRAEELAWFAERLNTQNIELVGILDQPPAEARERFGQEAGNLPIALVFLEPALWKPLIDPVMTRLSLKVHWWQLGSDDDLSYINFPNAKERIAEVRDHLNRFGQRVHLGIPWSWMNQAPLASDAPWDYISYTTSPPLTPAELKCYLEAPSSSGQRWVMLSPLPRSRYRVETRARDLVRRMLVAKIQGADAVFIPKPFSDEHGLMNEDGSPGELLLPWRTTSMLISNAEYLGQIQMPEGSENHVFVRDDQAIMVVWNNKPVVESIYLGEDVQQIELWGTRRHVELIEREGMPLQELSVGPIPTFVTGLDPAVARWRMSLQFDNARLASVFGRPQSAAFRFKNFFDQGIEGRMVLHAPREWQVEPITSTFRLAAGEEHTIHPRVLLQANATSGPQPVRIDFEVTADQHYRFSVYRTLEVGLGDVIIELNTRLDAHGRLVVEQTVINQTREMISLNCSLYIPNRRRQRLQVLNARHGRTTSVFVLQDGAELVGQTLWLRAEEIRGDRILNYQVIAKP